MMLITFSIKSRLHFAEVIIYSLLFTEKYKMKAKAQMGNKTIILLLLNNLKQDLQGLISGQVIQ